MSRLEEVEARLAHTVDSGWPSSDAAAEYRHLSRTLAAEVDASDEVITKLLDLTAPHVDEFGNRHWWHYKRPEQIYTRACEIAGRTE